MNKPLKDWTLGEIKAECEKHECCTAECPACRLENGRPCRIKYSPNTWNLSGPPRWTEQDKEDAKMIKRVLFWVNEVSRDEDKILYTLDGFLLNKELLPSLKPGESATLDEIIGGGE